MCGDNNNTRTVIDWSLPPKIQAQYDHVLAENKRLQLELGVKSMTIAERAAAYTKRKAEQAALQATLGKRRPPPKWKV